MCVRQCNFSFLPAPPDAKVYICPGSDAGVRLPPPPLDSLSEQQTHRSAAVSEMLKLRRAHAALALGAPEVAAVCNGQLGIARKHGSSLAMVLFNCEEDSVPGLPTDWAQHRLCCAPGTTLRKVLMIAGGLLQPIDPRQAADEVKVSEGGRLQVSKCKAGSLATLSAYMSLICRTIADPKPSDCCCGLPPTTNRDRRVLLLLLLLMMMTMMMMMMMMAMIVMMIIDGDDNDDDDGARGSKHILDASCTYNTGTPIDILRTRSVHV